MDNQDQENRGVRSQRPLGAPRTPLADVVDTERLNSSPFPVVVTNGLSSHHKRHGFIGNPGRININTNNDGRSNIPGNYPIINSDLIESDEYTHDHEDQQIFDSFVEERYVVSETEVPDSSPQRPLDDHIPGIDTIMRYDSPPSRDPPLPVSKSNSTIRTGLRRKEIIGDWILGKQLGKGANAHVRLAKNIQTRELAAIKVLPKRSRDAHDEDRDIKRGHLRIPQSYEREIAILRIMDHKHIVGLLDVFESATNLYLVMEFADGGELFGLINREGRMDEDTAMPIFRQILSGLYYCHMLNITHRDLKPENILVMADGTIKLADFGLGKVTPKGQLFSSACGSPHYIAPEIASFQDYDARKTDVWSLGCVLYTCLAGHLPFEGESQDDLLEAVRTGVYRIRGYFSEKAADLIKKMMCVDPEKRIKLDQLFKHPLVERYAPLDGMPGRPSDIYAGPLRMWDLAGPVIKSADDVDAETMQNLRILHPDKNDEQLIYQLKASAINGVKMLFCMLIKYRNEHPQCYPDMLECEIRGGDLATRLLDHPPTSHRLEKRSSTVSTVPSIAYYCDSDVDIEKMDEQVNGEYDSDTSEDWGRQKPNPFQDMIIESEEIVYEHAEYADDEESEEEEVITITNEDSHSEPRTPQPLGNAARRRLSSIKEEKSRMPPTIVESSRSGQIFKTPHKHHKRQISFHSRKRSYGGNPELDLDEEPMATSHRQQKSSLSRINYSRTIENAREMYNNTRLRESYDRAMKIKRKSRELESYINQQAHWTLRSTANDDTEDPFSSESPNSMAVVRGTPGSRITGFSNGSVDTSYTLLESPRTIVSETLVTGSIAAQDGSDMSVQPLVNHGEALGELQDRLNRFQHERCMQDPNSPNNDSDSEIYFEESTDGEQQVEADNVYQRISSGIAIGTANSFVATSTPKANIKTPPEFHITAPSEDSDDSILEVRATNDGIRFKAELENHKYGSFGKRYKDTNKSSAHLPLLMSTDDKISTSFLDPGQPRLIKKRSFLDILKGKKKASNDSAFETMRLSKLDTNILGTFGKRTFKKMMGKDTYKHIPIQSFFEGMNDEQQNVNIQQADGDSDEELDHIKRDEYQRIVEQQGLIQKILKVKPATRILCFNLTATQTRLEILRILRGWKRVGILITQDDKKGLVIRCELQPINHLAYKHMALVAEIRVAEGSRKRGTSVVRFTIEKGSTPSFVYTVDETYQILRRRGYIIHNPHKVIQMHKAFDT